jgi:uncharacterized SAM-binding protein YcdF (DUF218 family)
VATARFQAVRPVNPRPAALAAAETSSWAYAFVVAAILLFSAGIIGGWLLRPRRSPPQTEAPTTADGGADSPGAVVRGMARAGCHG